MNILFISQYFWPENFRINDLAMGLHERGNKVTVLTGIPNYPEGRFFPGYGLFNKVKQDYNGVSVRRVPLIPRGRGGWFRLVINYLTFTFFAIFLGPLICRDKYDVIFFSLSPFTEGFPALLFKWIKKAPTIYWVQDLWPESLSATGLVSSKKMLMFVERLIRLIYRGCDKVLVQSQAFIPSLERMGVEKERIDHLPYSAEELYRPVKLESDAPERLNIPGGFRIMFAGNIGASQDFDTILDAAEILREHPDIHWVIIGDGRLRQWVEEQVRDRGLSETFHLLGQHPVESMPRYFALADVMLVTLKKEPIFALTIPCKIQSYLACAKPVIAAIDGEGSRIISEAGAGMAVPAEAPEALARAVLEMSRMPASEREAMGRQSLEYFEDKFERNKLIILLEEWMKDLSGRA